MRKFLRTLAIWIVLFAVVVVLWQAKWASEPEWRDHAALVADLDAGRLLALRWEDERLVVRTEDGDYAVPPLLDSELATRISEAGVPFESGGGAGWWGPAVLTLLPILLILGLFLYFLRRQAGASTTSVLSLRKSPARLLAETSTVRFADVGGCHEAKDRLGDVVAFLRDPSPWATAGARMPRGVLLEGPPGCGKTLLARALAGETKARFYLISASEFVEMFVGVGAARVRDLFQTAAKNAPAVIFIDELDAVGRRRGSGIGASHDEREQTLNQLLVCLDGIERAARVVVLAATNRIDVLDRALLRPGRFDRRITVPALDREARLEVLRIHARGKALADAALPELAERTEGMTGADLETLINEAAIRAVRRAQADSGKVEIGDADLDAACAELRRRERVFDRVDLVLLESASQLSEPTGPALARLSLSDGATVEGEVLWADAAFIKVRSADGSTRVVAKSRVTGLAALAGTEAVRRDEVAPDPWAGRSPGAV